MRRDKGGDQKNRLGMKEEKRLGENYKGMEEGGNLLNIRRFKMP